MGQLGSDYILETLHGSEQRFQKQELAGHLFSHAVELERAGLRLADSLVDAASFKASLDRFLRYCVDKGILIKSSHDTYVIRREKVLSTTGSDYWQNPVQFSSNELRSLREVYPGL